MHCHGNPSKHMHAPTLSCLLKLIASVTVYNRSGKLTGHRVQALSCLPWIKSTPGMCLGNSICTLQGSQTSPSPLPHPVRPSSQHCRKSWLPGCFWCRWASETLATDGAPLWSAREVSRMSISLKGHDAGQLGEGNPVTTQKHLLGEKMH